MASPKILEQFQQTFNSFLIFENNFLTKIFVRCIEKGEKNAFKEQKLCPVEVSSTVQKARAFTNLCFGQYTKIWAMAVDESPFFVDVIVSFLPVYDFNTFVLANLCDVTIRRHQSVSNIYNEGLSSLPSPRMGCGRWS